MMRTRRSFLLSLGAATASTLLGKKVSAQPSEGNTHFEESKLALVLSKELPGNDVKWIRENDHLDGLKACSELVDAKKAAGAWDKNKKEIVNDILASYLVKMATPELKSARSPYSQRKAAHPSFSALSLPC